MNLGNDSRMPYAIAMGVIGGVVLGSFAFKHMFVEGLTDDERNGIFKASAVGLVAWGVAKLFDQEKLWWLNIDSIVNKAGTVQWK